eukprot:CAMPEP_0183339268 /NCGR_PEP_ID=MMETSP0164_2-20130417/6249_1 /TAXON_ID=221442 /ORGANISM="Coccolithus pelagicus ssp braarudi, Strain PLY182g" /LENGTH=49 /DNA_ID= /DNA_START= /DNA_END= /DNA_ORIENTATION=
MQRPALLEIAPIPVTKQTSAYPLHVAELRARPRSQADLATPSARLETPP